MKIVIGATAAAVLFAGAMGLASISPASALTNKECDAQWHSDPQGKAAGIKYKDYKAASCAAPQRRLRLPPLPRPPRRPPRLLRPPPRRLPAPMATPAMAPAPKPARWPRAPWAPMSSPPRPTPRTIARRTPWSGRTTKSKSKSWHYAGTKYYGKTKAGAYMCEADATADGLPRRQERNRRRSDLVPAQTALAYEAPPRSTRTGRRFRFRTEGDHAGHLLPPDRRAQKAAHPRHQRLEPHARPRARRDRQARRADRPRPRHSLSRGLFDRRQAHLHRSASAADLRISRHARSASTAIC